MIAALDVNPSDATHSNVLIVLETRTRYSYSIQLPIAYAGP